MMKMLTIIKEMSIRFFVRVFVQNFVCIFVVCVYFCPFVSY